MYGKLNRVIIESSIVFVSVFATIGLLVGATTGQFKTVYIYLGYMLYYSLPFIMACSFCVVAIVSRDEDTKYSEFASFLGTVLFLTGLIMLTFLASIATQTSLLPTSFTYLMPYPLVLFMEFYVFIIIFGTTTLGSDLPIVIIKSKRLRNLKSKRLKNNLRWSMFGVFSILFITGIITMGMFGVQQVKYATMSGSVSLVGLPNYTSESVNITLGLADQAVVRINSSESQQFEYVFVDTANYNLYKSNSTQSFTAARPIEYGNYGSDFSFTVVANASDVYYLMMKSDNFLGSNVTYSISASKLDNSFSLYALLGSTFCLSVVIVIATINPKDKTLEDKKCYYAV